MIHKIDLVDENLRAVQVSFRLDLAFLVVYWFPNSHTALTGPDCEDETFEDAFDELSLLDTELFGFRLRVWIPSFFIAIGRLT